jgi:serine/threonine-protein kinase
MAAAATHAPSTPARRIGNYLVLDSFASGGMATVHFGVRLETGGVPRVVAVKRLHPHLASQADFVAMFLDEARMAMRVRHPNVASVLDVVVAADELLIVMQYVAGPPLARFVAKRGQTPTPVPVPIASAIVSDALAGLEAAHEARDERGELLGLVHRDVSPQNLIVGTDGVTRIIDFGVAKAAGRLHVTREANVKGKIAYMAPEQLSARDVTRQADVYGAAVVLWETLTGRRLVTADHEAAIEQIMLGDFEPPSRWVPEVSHELDDVVMKGLARNVSTRWATAREMAAALQAAAPRATLTEVEAWVTGHAPAELATLAERVREIEESTIVSLSRDVPRPRSRRGVLVVAGAIAATAVAGIAGGWALARAPTVSTTPMAAASAPVATVEPSVLVPTVVAEAPPASASSSPPPAVAVSASSKPSAPRPSITRARSTAATSSPATPAVDCRVPWTIDDQGNKKYNPACLR